jgi:ABC-type tungstate transport system permease subunit
VPRCGRASRLGLIALLAAGCANAPAVAQVDTSATSTTSVSVVGTSDVFDSGLIQSVIAPGFTQAYPQYTLNYISKGTGAAITYAESGAADGLIVHAESLENQFVQPGAGKPSYSLEPAGRAVFAGDFVLLGPSGDPAGVAANDPHDVVDAFKAVALAGAAGQADFVSRGGTPGTTVEEHQIWALLVNSAGDSEVPGVTFCQLSAANGGGYSPSATSGPCPTSISYPAWYHATGLTQAPNVEAGDSCNFTNSQASGQDDCYVLTDRGTFDYLVSTGAISHLGIVTRDDSAAAPGGSTLLTNYFHAYAINPAAVPPGSNIDTTGAVDFLDYLTSAATQAAISGYLQGGGDTPPFTGDAQPRFIGVTSTLRHHAAAGTSQVVSGSLVNVAPATPALASQPVALTVFNNGTTTTVANATTGPDGSFRFRFRPEQSGAYAASTGTLIQTETAALSPVFEDLLSPANQALGLTDVKGAVTVKDTTVAGRNLTVKGTVGPAAVSTAGRLTLVVAEPGRRHRSFVETLGIGQKSFSVTARLPVGKNHFRVAWSDAGQFSKVTSAAKTVHIE